MPGIFDPGIFDSGIFDTDSSGTGSFTANAVILRTQTGSFTANAVLRKTQSGSFTADAVIPTRVTGSFTADALLKKIVTATFTENAVLKKTISGSFTSSAAFNIVFTGSFTADAIFGFNFTANAVISAPVPHTFKADAWIRNDDPDSGTPTTPYLVIEANGVDITDHVRISDAVFTTSVQGRPGSFHMSVKDVEHIYSFVAGTRITVDINGYRYFDGYAQRVSHQYAFPVVNTADADSVPRIWELEGPDLNILFLKRFVFDQDNPNRQLHIFPAGSDDDDIVKYYFNNYLSLAGDDLNYSGVEFVGSPNPDHDGAMADIGDSWAVAMAQIAGIPGAIWGLRPDRTLYYADTDTESAAFRLSDTPDNSTSFGYSNFEWAEDANKMVNDAQVWGAGQGSSHVVYSRSTDSPSIATHNKWQLPGQWRYDVYRQATSDHIAQSIVQGSTVNHHGAKDPAVVVKARIKKLGLLPGDRVHFTSDVFGVSRVLPIRRLTVRFASRHSAYFDLELSQEIDPPWSFAEFPGYNYKLPALPKLPRIIGDGWPPPEPGGCDCVVAGTLVDDFDGRSITIPPGTPGDERPGAWWGTSVIGPTWEITDVIPDPGPGHNSYSTAYIDGGIATLEYVPNGAADEGYLAQARIEQVHGFDYDADVLFKARWSGSSPDSDAEPYSTLGFGPTTGGGALGIGWNFNYTDPTAGWGISSTDPSIEIDVFTTAGFEFGIATFDFRDGNWYWYRLHREANSIHLRWWLDGQDEPTGWGLSQVLEGTPINWTDSGGNGAEFVVFLSPGAGSSGTYGPLRFDIDYLEFGGSNDCANVQFDAFERTVTSGWGMATGGYTWIAAGPGTGSEKVENGIGKMLQAGISQGQRNTYIPDGVDAIIGGDFTMTAKFQIHQRPTVYVGDDAVTYQHPALLFPAIGIDGTAQPDQGVAMWIRNPSASNADTIELVRYDGGTSTVVTHTWIEEVWYWLKWQRADGGATQRVKVWVNGSSEPASWLIEETGDTPATGVSLDLFHQGIGQGTIHDSTSAGDWEVWWDSIDFDYNGRPCSQDCVETTMLDDFGGRTVSSGGWGTASSGEVWTNGLSGGSASASVGSGVALASTSATSSFDTVSEQVDFDTPLPFPFTMHTKFQINHNADDITVNGRNDQNTWTVFCTPGGSSNEVGFNIYQRHLSGVSQTDLVLTRTGNSPNPDTDTIVTLTRDTWYELKLYVSPSEPVKYKLWLSSGSEPSWVTTDIIGPPSATSVSSLQYLHVAPPSGSGSTATWTVTTDFIETSGLCSDVAPSDGSPSVPTAGGYGCEVPTQDTSTVFHTSHSYVAGTLDVYRNGVFLVPGVGFTETTPSLGIFTLATGVTTEEIYVCYNAGGVPSSFTGKPA